jgi:hypothetical protein
MATLVEVVALNALSVGEAGSTGSTLGRASQRISRGRGSPSSEPRTSQNAVEGILSTYACGLDRRIRVGGASTQSHLGGSQGADSLGVYSF